MMLCAFLTFSLNLPHPFLSSSPSTEIIAYSDALQRFEEVGTKVIGISTDTEESHLSWIRTPRKKGGLGHMQIPLVADVTKTIAADYGVLLEDTGIALRGTFLIDPEGVLQQITVNNLPVGRNVDETIRLIQAFQFVAKHGEVRREGGREERREGGKNTREGEGQL
jgi:peroxiredoxin (alkyl hydroperoxide reductase subunit C)